MLSGAKHLISVGNKDEIRRLSARDGTRSFFAETLKKTGENLEIFKIHSLLERSPIFYPVQSAPARARSVDRNRRRRQ